MACTQPKAQTGTRQDHEAAMHSATRTRQDHEAAMHGDAGVKGGKEKKKKRRKKKEKKEKRIGRGKPAPEMPSPLLSVLTRPHSAVLARAGAMGTRWVV